MTPLESSRQPDSNDRRRMAQVHPADWSNPVPKGRYDLVVVGAGTGGLVTAAGAAGLGTRVALIEAHQMGGDCLNGGCVPSKAVIAAARAWHAARHAVVFGGPTVTGPGDFGLAMERMRRLRADLSVIDGAQRFTGLGVDVFFGRGRFTDRGHIEVGGQALSFRRAVIATGARAVVPPGPGLAESGYYTNESIFCLTELPQRLLVLGGGPIGCELAQAFARFGSQVTLVDRGDGLLTRDDPDASAIVHQALVDDGVTVALNASLERVERNGGDITLHCTIGGVHQTFTGDALLVATGRAPKVEDLGLERAGVAFERHGVKVTDRLRTSNRRIFAVGDVCSKLQFTHSADFQARLVVANALFFGRGRNSALVIPWATYTSPEVAHVGITVEDAARDGVQLDTVTVPMHDVDRAVLGGETEGFLRVHLRQGTDRILGVTIVDSHAGELIGEACVAVTNGLGLGALGKTMHPYPTRVEAYRKAADQWRRGKLTPTVRRLFALWFRAFRRIT